MPSATSWRHVEEQNQFDVVVDTRHIRASQAVTNVRKGKKSFIMVFSSEISKLLTLSNVCSRATLSSGAPGLVSRPLTRSDLESLTNHAGDTRSRHSVQSVEENTMRNNKIVGSGSDAYLSEEAS